MCVHLGKNSIISTSFTCCFFLCSEHVSTFLVDSANSVQIYIENARLNLDVSELCVNKGSKPAIRHTRTSTTQFKAIKKNRENVHPSSVRYIQNCVYHVWMCAEEDLPRYDQPPPVYGHRWFAEKKQQQKLITKTSLWRAMDRKSICIRANEIGHKWP